MNRKLLNGLLVLTVAAGGVGTFTSCKDEDARNPIIIGQLSLQEQIDKIRDLSDPVFQANLENWLASHHFDTEYPTFGFNTYEDATQAIQDMWDAFNQIKQGSLGFLDEAAQKALVQYVYDMMFNDIIKGSDWYQTISAAADTLRALTQGNGSKVTSVDINQTVNPVFGSIDLPIGLKTSVLASYLYDGKANGEYMFPTQVRDVMGGMSHLALNFDQNMDYVKALNVIQTLAADKAVELVNGSYTMGAGYGNMGSTYVNINPSNVNFAGNPNIQLVNSKDEVVLDGADGGLVVENNSDMLSFGYTRGDNTGVYKVNANAKGEFAGVTINVEDAKDYLNDVKAAVKDKSISNIGKLGGLLYEKINNRFPAYSLKVSWDEPVFDPVTGMVVKDEMGNVVTEVNSVHSSFDLAAAVIYPLSYGTPIAEGLGAAGLASKRLPMFSPLREYLEKIGNKLHMDFGNVEGVGEVEIDLFLTVDGGYVYAYNDAGEVVASFPYDSNGLNATPEAINSLLGAILDGVNWELNDDFNEKVVSQLNDAIAKINEELGQYNAKVDDFLAMVERNKAFDYATKLVDIYNKFAQKVNEVLTNPNHYLQVAMIYSDGEGHYHHLSTDPSDPTRAFPADSANALELLATSYTADLVAPSYLKYVAITGVNGRTATIDDNVKAGEMFNTVFAGQVNRVPMKVGGFNSGDVLTITYVSVDYHGICSMQNYYVKVK